jgi:hypothetical protein
MHVAQHLLACCVLAVRVKVQGPQCSLQLALTDKQSLEVLLRLLPFQGLLQLDLNVPYLPEGAAALLAEAAALQAAAANSHHTKQQQQLQAIARQPEGVPDCTEAWSSTSDMLAPAAAAAAKQQFSVGVWVCCWGGCTGISLSDAVSIQQQLRAVGCTLHGIESINCHSSSEVANMGSALGQLPGLKALGFNYKSSSSSKKEMPEHAHSPIAAGQADNCSSSGPRDDSSANAASWLQDANTAALASLVQLSSSLQQLTIHSYPAGGFMQFSSQKYSNAEASSSPSGSSGNYAVNPAAAAAAAAAGTAPAIPAQHPLASLTGLTKLQLLKQWHAKPLPVEPIALLTGLVESALERYGLCHNAELVCLSSLTRLTLLSLVLTVTADELMDQVKEGTWQLIGQGSAAAAAAAADIREMGSTQLEQEMNGLCVEDGVATAAGALADGCSCCIWDAEAAHVTTKNETAAGAGVLAAAGKLPSAAELKQQISACPCSAVTRSPSLLDWRWLLQLQQLRVAWLQVPHLDLACLPDSLTELDIQQPHDLTCVSITCSSNSSSRVGGSTSSSSEIWLPSLKRLVLPRMLQVNRAAACTQCTFPDGQELDKAAADDSSKEDTTVDDSDEGDEDELMQLHYNAALLLDLAAACPELQELELVQWQLPPAAVLAAAQQLRHLKLLSLLQPGSKAEEEALQQQLAGVRAAGVQLRLQERLVLSSYPWSSVLAVR